MTLKLSTLSILLGLGVGLPQIYGLVKPAAFAAAVRKFPRSLPWGVALVAFGTLWFLWNLSLESLADFATYKNVLFMLFAAVGLGTCIFVQDFLAVRGLAIVLLLLAKLMVDTGRPALPQTHWVLVIQTWAYVLVVAGIWFTISPWRLRDFLVWGTANEWRIKVGCGLRLAFGLFVAALGLTIFRTVT
jgi:predicted DNA-binding transcriptional regulator AlpA